MTTTSKPKSSKKSGNRIRSPGEPITPDRSYTFHQLAAAFGVSSMTLWRRINEQGLGEFGAKCGADWLFTGRRVLEWIESRSRVNNDGPQGV